MKSLKMNKNILAFTLIELLISIVIIAILSVVWLISYKDSISEARNSARMSDMSNIKIWLKNHKLKNWLYPLPWNYFSITNSWTAIVQEWLLSSDVSTQEIINKPFDPLITTRNYTYSILNNKLKFQIWMVLEDNWVNNISNLKSYVDWDYQKVAEFLPWIIFATSTWWEIKVLSWSIVIDKWIYNLPYDESWNPYNPWMSLTWILSQIWINIPTFYWYVSCDDILQNWASSWSWIYWINPTWTGATQTGCVIP